MAPDLRFDDMTSRDVSTGVPPLSVSHRCWVLTGRHSFRLPGGMLGRQQQRHEFAAAQPWDETNRPIERVPPCESY